MSATPPPPKRRRGPGRPFKPGQSGNPGGRPKTNREVVELARSAADIAIQTLIELTRSGPGPVRVQAARALLDRGYGKPTQTIAVTGLEDAPEDIGKTLEEMTDAELRILAGEGPAAAPSTPDHQPGGGAGQGPGGAGPTPPR